MITQRVMAELQKRMPPGNQAVPASRAVIHAPMGVCTGDYSKFPELKGKGVGAAPPVLVAAPVPVALVAPVVADTGPVLSGVIIAKQIENLRGVIRLTPGARLTPAAQDVVRDHKLKVERIGAADVVHATGAGAAKPKAAGMGEFVWWIAGNCAAVDQVTPAFRTELAPLPNVRQPSSLVPVIREISKRIKSGRAVGGILFVPGAAAAACFANRCPALRAVVGTCAGAVEEGIRLIGANVLIVEYPHHGWRAMQEMLERFVREPRPSLSEIERQLQELGTCA